MNTSNTKLMLIEDRITRSLGSDDLDPTKFEKATCKLLDRHLLPLGLRVVHIEAGSSGRDNGFDGEVRRHNGEDPAPLIITTSQGRTGPRANLKKNLKSVQKFGNKSTEVYFTCRKKLDAEDITKLTECAGEAGRTLYHYDVGWFVAQLQQVENQDICKSLLGFYPPLTGLTYITRSIAQMPDLEVKFLGREVSIEWLNEQTKKGDCLVVGQSGIGKTSLLNEFVKQDKALFLTTNPNVDEVADFLKNSEFIVVVEDAYNHMDDLRSLMRVRQERQCKFQIVATSWPNERDAVINVLGLGAPEIELAILDGKTIVDIVKSIKYKNQKICLPVDWMNTIRQQANGKPGLAVTLTSACLKDQNNEQSQGKVIGDLWKGELLRQYLFGQFDEHHIQEQIKHVLAAFALGGKDGVTHRAIMKFLDLKKIELAPDIKALGQYGVLETYQDTDELKFSLVVPERLRGALATHYFFNKNPPLNYRDLEVRNKSELVRTMIESRWLNGAVASDLDNIVRNSTIVDSKLLAYYARLGEREALLAIRLQPDSVDVLASALYTADTLVLPKLLEKFKATLSESIYSPEYLNGSETRRMQEILNQWILDDRNNDISLSRHQKLISAIDQFAQTETNSSAITEQHLAVAKVLSLMLRTTFDTLEAGETPDTKTLRLGCLSGAILYSYAELWELFLQFVQKLNKSLSNQSSRDQTWKKLWDIVQQAVGYWQFDITKRGLTKQDQAFMKDKLGDVLTQILGMVEGEGGYVRYFIDVAKREDIKLKDDLLQSNPEFDLIFPLKWDAVEERKGEIEQLALEKVNSMRIKKLAAWLDDLFVKRPEQGGNVPGFIYLCEVLAMKVTSLCELANKLLELRSNSQAAVQLLRFMAKDKNNDVDTLTLVDKCLEQNDIRVVALRVLVSEIANISDDVFEHIRPYLEEAGEELQYACTYPFKSFSERLQQLFTHPSPRVALYAAIGHWNSVHDATAKLQPAIQYPDEWKKALLGSLKLDLNFTGNYTSGDIHYWLGKILAKESALAVQWIGDVLQSKQHLDHDMREIFKEVLPTLANQQRLTLLARMQWDENSYVYGFEEIFSYLVNQDLEVYRELLRREDLKEFHLEPLALIQSQEINQKWKQIAKAAIIQGITPGEIFNVILYPRTITTTWGKDSEVLTGYLNKLSELEGDTELQQIYQSAKKHLEPKIKEAQQTERAWSNS